MTIAIVNNRHLFESTMPSEPPRHKNKKSHQQDEVKKAPRLRTSCNECADAKVGCTKEHPRCDRCVHKKLDCVYGISQKHGKSQRRKIESSPSKRLLETHFAIPRRQASFTSSDRSSPLPGQLRDIRPSYDGMTSPYHQTLSNSPSWSTTSSDLPTSTMPVDFSYLDNTHYTSVDSPNIFASVSGIKTPPEPNFFPAQLSDQYLSTITQSRNITPTSPRWENPYSTSALSASLTEATTISSPSYTSSPSTTSSICPRFLAGSAECNTEASNLLTLLQSHPHLPYQQSSPIPTPPSSHPHPSYDAILNLIQRTFTTLDCIQECTCAKEHHIAMLQHSIILKLLDWHRSANTSLTHNSNSSSSAYPSPMPVSIGTFTPNPDDAVSIQRMLLMRSLQNLAKLIRDIEARCAKSERVRGLFEGAKRELGRVVKNVERGAARR